MAPKNIKVRPGKEQSKISFYISIVFVFIGFTIAIPLFGLFGIFWTAVACLGCYNAYKQGYTDEGMPAYEISIDETDTSDIEARLKKLENLYNSGLITRDEYDVKRKEILDEI